MAKFSDEAPVPALKLKTLFDEEIASSKFFENNKDEYDGEVPRPREIQTQSTDPNFVKIHQTFTELQDLHARKNADYTVDNDTFFNFRLAGYLGSFFRNSTLADDVDISFWNLICTKIARLCALYYNGRTANNESIADTKRDLAVYFVKWAAWDDEK